MRDELASFWAAVGYFTRIPVPASAGDAMAPLARAAHWLPLIGLLVGAFGAAVTLVALQVWPQPIAVLLGMGATLVLTGALHEDGLADTLDGLGGGATREDALRIMKDPRLGSFGALGLMLTLSLKFLALDALAASSPSFFALALISAHAASRFAATVLIFTLEYARVEGKAKPLTTLTKGGFVFAAGVGLAPSLALPWSQAAFAWLFAALATLSAACLFKRRLGGYTGDCLGATQQISELAFYLGLLCACG
ncbi:MAG: adenosylcobinamide-GDP ribazoletransferase [Rhodocyclaceae bacterium]|nr:adenosylcobinamide-GDP ribazoletransferase [Rhodocyclaceae bacterium]